MFPQAFLLISSRPGRAVQRSQAQHTCFENYILINCGLLSVFPWMVNVSLCSTLSPRKYSFAGVLALASFSAAFFFASALASKRRNWCRFDGDKTRTRRGGETGISLRQLIGCWAGRQSSRNPTQRDATQCCRHPFGANEHFVPLLRDRLMRGSRTGTTRRKSSVGDDVTPNKAYGGLDYRVYHGEKTVHAQNTYQ